MTILWPNILGHQQRALNSLLTTIPNRNYRSDRPGGLILYITIHYCTVLYKNEKICPNQTDRQTKNVSKTEVHSIPLWILSGYTRELANIIL